MADPQNSLAAGQAPRATYRLQLNRDFGFQRAGEVAPYLAELGVSHLYASPILKARRGSAHGYDVVDPGQINPELGAPAEFERLAETLQGHGLGLVLDIVPNHMAFDRDNPWLMDVLENGPASPYFQVFDVEWDFPQPALHGRLLAPFLGRLYGESLEDGEISLDYDQNGFWVRYFGLGLPLSLDTYADILAPGLARLKRELGEDHPDHLALLALLYLLKNPPGQEEAADRATQVKFIKQTLWQLFSRNPAVGKHLEDNLAAFRGRRGDSMSFNRLDALLGRQLFRLAFWKVAREELNYRRFFIINDLISLNADQEKTFALSHALVLDLAARGLVQGLRVDHIDGLADPRGYLERLREKAGGLYLAVEKILDYGEELPRDWPVQGTTGYEFLNQVNGVFVQRANDRAFQSLYRAFTGQKDDYDDLVYQAKKLIILGHMLGDIDNLARLLKNVSSRYRHGSDVTLYGIKEALIEIMAHFPVYRTYIQGERPGREDHAHTHRAARAAKERNHQLANEINFVQRFLLLAYPSFLAKEERRAWLSFTRRFQQFTGPLMAKGYEDTLLYVYNRLISLNEVGGRADAFGVRLPDFHRFMQRRRRRWPQSMNASATHDTKRGEDARARLNVLSEMPREWARRLGVWARLNARRKTRLPHLAAAPDRGDEYLLYQAVLGALPAGREPDADFLARIQEYAVKAVREAKRRTGWVEPDLAYEKALLDFAQAILTPGPDNAFLPDFLEFHRRVCFYGVFNSLSQTVIKLTAPGLPDFYQGSELWDLSLVDPDNRRPVDFELRRRLLAEVRREAQRDLPALLKDMLARPQDGRVKLYLIERGLAARRRMERLFSQGEYLALAPAGRHAERLVAFARRLDRQWALVLAPRFLTGLVEEGRPPLGPEVWEDTRLDLEAPLPSKWREVISETALPPGRSIMAGQALGAFPVALLVAE